MLSDDLLLTRVAGPRGFLVLVQTCDSGEDGEDEFDAGVPIQDLCPHRCRSRNRFAALRLEFDLTHVDFGESGVTQSPLTMEPAQEVFEADAGWS